MKKSILLLAVMLLAWCDWWVSYNFYVTNSTGSEIKLIFQSKGEDFSTGDQTNDITEFVLADGQTVMVRRIMGQVNGPVENIIGDGIPSWLKFTVYNGNTKVTDVATDNWTYSPNHRKHHADYHQTIARQNR